MGPAWRISVPVVNPASLQLTRSASGGSKKAVASKPKATGATGAAGASPAATGPRRGPPADWAALPLELGDLEEAFRRRRARLVRRREELLAEAKAAEAKGYEGSSRAQAALAEAEALPVPPADNGAAALAAATGTGTSFEAALESMTSLLKAGILLDPSAHLAPLLRKAGSPAALAQALGALRLNHLAQAGAKLGSHEAAQGSLHAVVVQECQRLGSAAPLLELWESVWEHGMEPSAEAAAAAVAAAVGLGDGRAAAALLALTAQYGAEPLAGPAQVAAVVSLLEKGKPEDASELKGLLPRLGFRA
ncbi:hypothetical protein HYH03_004369 [Edaphochlamys debaryana]|uniref:Uncharacterized protein n=1 Tax=Edaphochlamys debaryana TaxID=47281 RepID=A0A835YHB4_9CHLO|nr:hypothetical protein HYH03_004369 [Edaphochlamys debaryana]|eukprot:KAG2497629.1 hypothetical protein HYH03_004369 [Edaphochlamys debaryana]